MRKQEIVAARVSRTLKRWVEKIVEEGNYLNVSDFVRDAVREKVQMTWMGLNRNILTDFVRRIIHHELAEVNSKSARAESSNGFLSPPQQQGEGVEVKVKHPSQRYLNEIFTYRALLTRILKGAYQSKISKHWKWSKQKVNYWFRKLKQVGLITEEVRSTITIYTLTRKGKDFLTWSEDAFKWSLFLHGLGLKFPLLDCDSRFEGLNWKVVPLKNWVKKTLRVQGVEGDFSVERTSKSVIVWCKGRCGVHPYQLFFEAVRDVLRFAQVLQRKYGVRLGAPSLVRKPHFGIVDPLLTRVNTEVQVTGLHEWTDDSPVPGSVEFFDPVRIVQYLRMPAKVDEMTQHLGEAADQLKVFGEGVKEHMKLIRALQDVATAMKESVDMNTKLRIFNAKDEG